MQRVFLIYKKINIIVLALSLLKFLEGIRICQRTNRGNMQISRSKKRISLDVYKRSNRRNMHNSC